MNRLLLVVVALAAGGGTWGFSILVRTMVRSVLHDADATKILEGRHESHGHWEHGEMKLEARCHEWPIGPQVYAQYDDKGACVYIGQARDLKSRFASHGHDERPFEHRWTTWKAWSCEATELDYVERTLIQMKRPKGNVVKYVNHNRRRAST